MEKGSVLVDHASGMKLLVVETPPQTHQASCVAVDGRQMQREDVVPAGIVVVDACLEFVSIIERP